MFSVETRSQAKHAVIEKIKRDFKSSCFFCPLIAVALAQNSHGMYSIMEYCTEATESVFNSFIFSFQAKSQFENNSETD